MITTKIKQNDEDLIALSGPQSLSMAIDKLTANFRHFGRKKTYKGPLALTH
ncbi:hypothetical protein predicted by Glimmer/Critica [Bdellovibrio bacteriovorus HD100]|uniref:Uncharacterized protein n=1 Tax=Bdellovibrio bacteriovorus (strain ATCC 15356 / DSM 50701 / NCIMB 9529 / HD100) TaxID=264462 RepID=Q6MPN1_BDEBA|nr:hypothetical protein predicted by Glimmer/Critica [Bdellovibrio bacteriovorus HD100]